MRKKDRTEADEAKRQERKQKKKKRNKERGAKKKQKEEKQQEKAAKRREKQRQQTVKAQTKESCETTSNTQHSKPWPAARSGHAMTYDPKSKLVYMHGGYNGRKTLADFWCISIGRSEFPSLVNICADAVRKHRVDFESAVLPEEIKDVLKQKKLEELKWEKLADVAAIPLTTASMTIHDGKLWLIGGGSGANIYSYHLESKEWETIEPVESSDFKDAYYLSSCFNGDTLTVYHEPKLGTFNMDSKKFQILRDGFGPGLRRPPPLNSQLPQQHAYKNTLFYSATNMPLYYISLDQTQSPPWKEYTSDSSSLIGAVCFFERWFFRFCKKRVFVLDLETIEDEKPKEKIIPYSREISLGNYCGLVRGEPPRFLLFGGMLGASYLATTYLIEFGTNWESATATELEATTNENL